MSARRREPFPQLPFTAQDDFFDAIIRHQIFLQRFTNGVTQQAADLLNNDEAFFRSVIFDRIKTITQAPSVRNLSKTDRMIRTMIERRQTSWRAIRELWSAEYLALLIEEPRFIDRTLRRVLPVEIATTLPPAAVSRDLLRQTRYQGRTLRQWITNLQMADARIIRTTVASSVGQGLGPVAASRALIGTQRDDGLNGATQTTRNHLAAVAQTSTTGLGYFGRLSYWTANAELIEGERFTAILDGRTTPICQATDGEQHPAGEGPIPPLHIRCRSTRVPILNGELIGRKNATPLFERRTLREFAQANGLATVTRRADLPRGFKGKYDLFSQQRAIQVVGTEPLATTYPQWLTRQPAQFQNDVLGVTRGKLFRSGGLNVDSFVDSGGRQLTLDELSRREASAFTAAGLDPNDPKWARFQTSANPGPGD